MSFPNLSKRTRDHLKPLSEAQWHQCQQRSLRRGAEVLRAYVGCIHARVDHVEPEQAFSQASSLATTSVAYPCV